MSTCFSKDIPTTPLTSDDHDERLASTSTPARRCCAEPCSAALTDPSPRDQRVVDAAQRKLGNRIRVHACVSRRRSDGQGRNVVAHVYDSPRVRPEPPNRPKFLLRCPVLLRRGVVAYGEKVSSRWSCSIFATHAPGANTKTPTSWRLLRRRSFSFT